MKRIIGHKWRLIGAIAILTTVLAFVQIFGKPMRVMGDCMEPAIRNGQWIFVDRSAFYRYAPAAGQIVIFNHDGQVWVSRIVAVGRDRIELRADGVHVNGSLVAEAAVERDWREWNQHGEYAIRQPLDVPENHVYVLSDKLSAKHDDSRVFGPIACDQIAGKVL